MTNIETTFVLIAFLGILILLISLLFGLFGHVGDQDSGSDTLGDDSAPSGGGDAHHHDTHHYHGHHHDDHHGNHNHHPPSFLSMKFLLVSPRSIGLFCAIFGGVGYFLITKVGFFKEESILHTGTAVLIAALIAIVVVYIYQREQQLMDSIETGCMEPCDLVGKEATVVQRVYPNINGRVAIHEAGQAPTEHLARSCNGETIPSGEKVIIVMQGLELGVRRTLKYKEGVALQDFHLGSVGLIKVQEQILRATLVEGDFVGKGENVLIIKDGEIPETKAC